MPWESVLREIRSVDADSLQKSYVSLRRDFVHLCGLGDKERCLSGKMAREVSRTTYSRLQGEYTINDMQDVIEVLHIPRWYRLPLESTFSELLGGVTTFLTFLNVSGFVDALVGSKPQEFIRWIQTQRVAEPGPS